MSNDSSTSYKTPDTTYSTKTHDEGVPPQFASEFSKLTNELNSFYSKMENSLKISEIKIESKIEKNVYEKIDSKINTASDKLESKQINSIQVLGIFVALFTFVSGSFQIYKMIDNINSAVVFTALVAGLSVFILFIVTLLLFIRNRKYAFIWSTAVLVFSLGIIIYSLYFFQNNGVMKQTADSSANQIITNNNNLEGAK